jgi:hypothetical protein
LVFARIPHRDLYVIVDEYDNFANTLLTTPGSPLVFSPGYIKHGLSQALSNKIQDSEDFDLQIEKQNSKN